MPTRTDSAQARYDAAQTIAVDAVRARLQSIASLAVEAQSADCGDPLTDLLTTIADDIEITQAIQNAIQLDDVYRAAAIARTGRKDAQPDRPSRYGAAQPEQPEPIHLIPSGLHTTRCGRVARTAGLRTTRYPALTTCAECAAQFNNSERRTASGQPDEPADVE